MYLVLDPNGSPSPCREKRCNHVDSASGENQVRFQGNRQASHAFKIHAIFPMKINVSAVKTFLYDQLDWFYQYHLRRVPRRHEPALELGSLWHILLEEFTKTGSREEAKNAGQLAVGEATKKIDSPLVISEFEHAAEGLFNLFDAYKERYEFDETLLIESPLETQLLGGPHTLVGRPDRVVRYQGKLWHVQNRTLSDRTVMPVYLAAAERDLHELAYAFLIQRHFKLHQDAYGGTLMNIVRKVSKKKLAEDPDAAFVQEFIPIAPEQVAEAIEDIIQVADDMESIISGRRRAVQNRESDKGRFGNRLSPYFEVRRGRATLYEDSLFEGATSRYDQDSAPAEVA